MSEDASDFEDYGPIEPRTEGAFAPASTPPPDACGGTEQLLTSIMESFAKMQVETNKTLVATLRSLSYCPCRTQLKSNFGMCTARFDGSDDPEVFEEFLDAVMVYKECYNVSDEEALKSLPLLLTGDAAVWWRGVRTSSSVRDWSTAVTRLRSMYGTPRPSYEILREIFASEQKWSERAEIFLCKLRSKLSKLPYVVPTRMQIDIMYGLLHQRVRKHLCRDDFVDNIDLFIDKVKIVEDAVKEMQNKDKRRRGKPRQEN